MAAIVAFVFGLVIGSFLNVCIHRWPRNRSVIKPRSHCVRCRKPIAWYDNIPLVSYAILRGRCRHCGKRISWRYPLVELLTGALFFAIVQQMGPTAAALKSCVFSAILVALIFSDLEKRLLPDELTKAVSSSVSPLPSSLRFRTFPLRSCFPYSAWNRPSGYCPWPEALSGHSGRRFFSGLPAGCMARSVIVKVSVSAT